MNPIPRSILTFVAACTASAGLASETPTGVQARLDAAQRQQAAEVAAAPPQRQGLLFYADFERDEAQFGDEGAIDLPLASGQRRPGRFGSGACFERPRRNLLPPEIAAVGATSPFGAPGGGEPPRIIDAATPVGKRAAVLALPASGLPAETPAVQVSHGGLSWHEKTWVLLGSVYVQGASGRVVVASLRLLPDAADTNAPLADLKEPWAQPQRVTLDGGWQRVACATAAHAAPVPRRAILALASGDGRPLELRADGLQFEPVRYYPHGHIAPTAWVPGGTKVPASSLALRSPLCARFPAAAGTVALWSRAVIESNLHETGDLCWWSLGFGWLPRFGMGTYRSSTPGGGVYCRDPRWFDGAWHHAAMTWSGTSAQVYLDGEFFRRFTIAPTNAVPETFVMMLGGDVSDGQTANAILDEFAIFNRALAPGELAALASATRPLSPPAAALRLAVGPRSVFYRDEGEAPLAVAVRDAAGGGRSVALDLAVGDLLTATTTVTLVDGRGRACFPLAASALRSGTYRCRVGAAGSPGGYLEFPIEVVPALRPDHYLAAAWGIDVVTRPWREKFRALGLNTIDTYDSNIETLGREGFFYSWHANVGNGIASPAALAAARATVRREAEVRRDFPNWRFTLFNSEVAPGILPPESERPAWFDGEVRRGAGVALPDAALWHFGDCNHFPQVRLAGGEVASNGVYRASPGWHFLNWWYNAGCGWWRINAAGADEVRRLRPDVICWTDPLGSPGQVAGLQAGSTWSYEVDPGRLIAAFRMSLASRPDDTLPFFATLGNDYVMDWLNAVPMPGGVTNRLAPTGDDLIQQAWIAAAGLPTQGLTYWSLNDPSPQIYQEPAALARLGAAMRRDILPAATMLMNLPAATPPVALLLPESTTWAIAGEGGWNWGATHYASQWTLWLDQAGIDYDIVPQHRATAANLRRYAAVVFPMARYVEQGVHDALTEAAAGGTRVIVDAYARVSYPNGERWPMEYIHIRTTPGDFGAITPNAVARLQTLADVLRPRTAAWAQGEAGRVRTFVRISGDARYVVVVNDCRQSGPYTDWTRRPDFQPYGRAQRATVTLQAPHGCAVYELTTSRLLESRPTAAGLEVDVDLPAHGARVLCVYPRPFKRLRIETAARYRCGETAAFAVTLRDAGGAPPPGCQLLDVTIRDPSGAIHDESGFYRLQEGCALIPFRPARNEAAGRWRLEVRERSSGRVASQSVRVLACE